MKEEKIVKFKGTIDRIVYQSDNFKVYGVRVDVKKYPYMHRDIRPSNLIYSKKKLYLIDFQFAVQINNQTFKELQFLLDRPKTRLVLGDEFRKSEEEWDDLYSIDRIYEMLN